MQYNAPNRMYVFHNFSWSDTSEPPFGAWTQNRAPPLQNPGCTPGDHNSMKDIHWLPVRFRIKFKLRVIMHAAVSVTSSDYIKYLLTPTIEIPGRSRLRSAVAGDFCVPKFNLEFGRRAFSLAGPMECNALPVSVRNIKDKTSFRKALRLVKLACNC